MGIGQLLSLICLAACGHCVADEGDSIIRAKAGPSDIVITTTQRLVGAIQALPQFTLCPK